jgi:hypothetical protein
MKPLTPERTTPEMIEEEKEGPYNIVPTLKALAEGNTPFNSRIEECWNLTFHSENISMKNCIHRQQTD